MHKIILLFIILIALPTKSYALSCPHYYDQVAGHDIVYKARLLDSVATGDCNNIAGCSDILHLDNLEIYKGEAAAKKLGINPENITSYTNRFKLGQTYIIFADFAGNKISVIGCEPLLTMQSVNGVEKFDKIYLLADLKKFLAQEKALKDLIEIYPENFRDTYLRLGRFYEENLDYVAAEQAYKEALQKLYQNWIAEKNIENAPVPEPDRFLTAEIASSEFVEQKYVAEFLNYYGRVLFQQEDYAGALLPLQTNWNLGRSHKAYLHAAFIKLGLEEELDAINFGSADNTDPFNGIGLKNNYRRNLFSQILSEKDFSNLNLEVVSCHGCNLRKANFENVHSVFSLKESDLRGVNFKGAEFIESYKRGLPKSGFQGAIYDDTTVWPEGFSPEEAGAIRKE